MMLKQSWKCSDSESELWDKRHMFTTQTVLQLLCTQRWKLMKTKSGASTGVQPFSCLFLWNLLCGVQLVTMATKLAVLIGSRWALKLHFHLNGNSSPNLPFLINHLSPVTARPRPPPSPLVCGSTYRSSLQTNTLYRQTGPFNSPYLSAEKCSTIQFPGDGDLLHVVIWRNSQTGASLEPVN